MNERKNDEKKSFIFFVYFLRLFLDCRFLKFVAFSKVKKKWNPLKINKKKWNPLNKCPTSYFFSPQKKKFIQKDRPTIKSFKAIKFSIKSFKAIKVETFLLFFPKIFTKLVKFFFCHLRKFFFFDFFVCPKGKKIRYKIKYTVFIVYGINLQYKKINLQYPVNLPYKINLL